MSSENEKKKIAVIGDKDSILGFRAVGFDVVFCEDPSQAEGILREMCQSGDYGIIYMTDTLYSQTLSVSDRYKDSFIPAIIPIPSKLGSSGVGVSNIKKTVEKAVGADILFKNER